jgi:hypothetical protein
VLGLAKYAEVTFEQCVEALALFLAPDEYNQTVSHEGQRIVEIDGGWRLTGHFKYHPRQQAADNDEDTPHGTT